MVGSLNLGLRDLIYTCVVHWYLLGHGNSLFLGLIQFFTIRERVLPFVLRWWIGCVSGNRPYTSRNLSCHIILGHGDVRITYIRQLLLFLLFIDSSLAFLSSQFDEVCALFAWGQRWWVNSNLTLKRAIQNLAPILEIELSVWIGGLVWSFCLTVRPSHVYTAIVIRKDMVP